VQPVAQDGDVTDPAAAPELASVPDRQQGPARRVVPATGGYDLLLRLPYAARAGLDLQRVGDDLVLDASSGRLPPAVIALPGALCRCRIADAALERPLQRDTVLRVRFEPDPERWPRA
jgi:hypothetical protein